MKRARVRLGSAPAIGLAFLDVLCCGLGAAVFLLLVIQRGLSPVAAEELFVDDEIARVESAIETTERRIAGARDSIAAVAEAITRATAAMQAVAGLSDLQRKQVRDALAALQGEREKLDAETALANVPAETPAPPVPVRQHLTGLRIEDDRVAVFLDSSASMLDQTLVGILRLRVSSDRLKRSAAKWTTARNTAKWVYDRIPDGGRFHAFHYADRIRALPGGAVAAGPISWRTKAGTVPTARPDPFETALRRIVPDGPTDLRAVFETADRLAPPPTQIVLITDGLPTLPGDTPLRRLRGCRRPPRTGVPLISSACRASIFENAAVVALQRLPNTRIDIILLPLEGDASATGRYWELALAAGGQLLTPAQGWPPT